MNKKNKPLLLQLSVFAFVIILYGCDKSEDSLFQLPHSEYWGCWREATGKKGVYDIILTENNSQPHNFAIGDSCGKNGFVASLDVGVFRNDTLILDNGINEYWCYIQGDTLLYSASIGGFDAPIEKFILVKD